MEKHESGIKRPVNRRSLLKSGLLAGGAAVVSAGTGLFSGGKSAFGQEFALGQNSGGGLTRGDVAILRFLAVAELIESDLWTQYAELGGIGNNPPIEVDPNQQLNSYQAALSNLDGDGPQYITSNTNDEISHATFLNGYLESKGADPVNFDEFRTLQGSTATGAQDFGATFPQAVKITNRTAIPITDADFGDADHIQVIANTAAFHFGYIEQGGASLYAALSQKVKHREVLE